MSGLTRRQFGRSVIAGAVVLGTAGATGLGLAMSGGGVYGFAVEHGETVLVRVGNGERFTVEVVDRATGDVLERADDLDLDGVLGFRSDHVRFSRITPPGL